MSTVDPTVRATGWQAWAAVVVAVVLLGPVGGIAALAVLAWAHLGRATTARVVALAALLLIAMAVGWLADGVPRTAEIVSFTNLGGRGWLDGLGRAALGVLTMSVVLPDEAMPTPATRPVRGRLPEVDRLRAVAIVVVVVIHGLPFRPPITDYLDYWLADVLRFSVAALFLASGWLVPTSAAAVGWQWVRRRLARLLPAYLVASLVMITLARLTPAIDERPLVRSLLLGDAVGPYYFVVVLVVLVLVTPLLVRLSPRATGLLLVVAAGVSLGIELADLSIYAHNHLPLTWLPFYLAGIAGRARRERLRVAASHLLAAGVPISAVVVVAIGFLPIETGPRRALVWVGMWAITATLLASGLDARRRSGTWRTTATLSASSYTIYLYHPPVVAGIAGVFGSAAVTGRPFVAALTALLTCLAVAHLGRLAWPDRARWLGA